MYSDDSKLWSAFQQGDEQAYSLMYQQFVPNLFSYGMKICRNEDLVRDCIQDLFVYIWDNRRTLGQVQSIKFYLSSSLKRELIRRINRTNQPLFLEKDALDAYDFEIALDVESLTIQEEMSSEQIKRLRDLLNQLPPRQKEAIYLCFYENLSYAQIAELMNIAEGVAYNFVYRALLVLKRNMVSIIVMLIVFESNTV